jgi:hypothetical protein
MWFAGLIGLGICIVSVVLLTKSETQMLRRRFSDRGHIPVDVQLTPFAGEHSLSLEKATLIWCEIAKTLQVEPEKLRIDDRFDRELKPIKGMEFDDHLSALTLLLQGWAREERKGMDVKSLITIGDCLIALAGSEKIRR